MSSPVPIAGLGLAAVCAGLLLGGCGGGSARGQPSAGGVPLPGGVRVAASARRCDGGAHPYCARELVLVAPRGRYPSSTALQLAEAALLHRRGWSQTQGQTMLEMAAGSPGNRLQVTYATAEHDLIAVDEGSIMRAEPIARALSQTLYARAPALSLIVQSGSA